MVAVATSNALVMLATPLMIVNFLVLFIVRVCIYHHSNSHYILNIISKKRYKRFALNFFYYTLPNDYRYVLMARKNIIWLTYQHTSGIFMAIRKYILKEYSDMKYQSNDQYLLYTRHEDLEQASQKNLRAEIPCWTIFQIHHMWDYKAIYPPFHN